MSIKTFNIKVNDYSIPVIYQKNKEKKTGIIFNFDIGSLWESDKEKGIAHLVEHLMFKDTGKHSSSEVLKLLEISGANVNACTSFEFTRFYFNSSTKSFESILKLFVEMLSYKDIPKNEFEKEKSTVIQELKMCKDDPQNSSYFNLIKRTNNVDPIVGFEKVLKKITLKDVYRWIDKYITLNNMTISIDTSLTKRQTSKILTPYLKSFRINEDKELLEYKKAKALNNLKHNINKTVKKENKTSNQAYIVMTYELKDLKTWGDYVKAHVLEDILSGGLTSILFREIREKFGYCYRIKAYYEQLLDKEFSKKFTPCISVNTNCMPKYLDSCILEIKKVMNNLSNVVTEEDLTKVRNKLDNQELPIIEIAESMLSMYKINDNIKCLNMYEEIYKSITLEELKTFIKEHLDTEEKDLNIGIYGKLK